MPWARSFCPFRAYGTKLAKLLFHEIIIFYKMNIILDLFLRYLEILVTFARKALLDMKIQEVMKLQRKSLISININRRFIDIGG